MNDPGGNRSYAKSLAMYAQGDGLSACGPEFRSTPVHRNRVVCLLALLDGRQDASRKRVLEIGCGVGNVAAALAARGFQIKAIDIRESSIALARSRHAFPNLDFECVPAVRDPKECPQPGTMNRESHLIPSFSVNEGECVWRSAGAFRRRRFVSSRGAFHAV